MSIHREYKTVFSIASIYAFRMLGLFMLLPIFTIYADELNGANHFLLGIAFGIYGLTQAIFQIPMGIWSDKIGRKPVIATGLVIFSLGSLIAAFATNIWVMIIARAIQGAGAIGSALMALITDSTEEKTRTKAMAIIGMVIGISFSIAIIISPSIASRFDLSGVFILTALLALFGIAILFTIPSTKQTSHLEKKLSKKVLKQTITDIELLRLNFGIFFQHAIFTASFYALPLILEKKIHPVTYYYLPLLIFAFITMSPLLIFAEKKQKMKPIFLGAIISIIVSQCLLSITYMNLFLMTAPLFLYFVVFNLLEATLPSLISKMAPKETKGTAMGIYSCCQFMGIFFGATLAGIVYSHYQASGVFILCSLLSSIWLITAKGMKNYRKLSSHVINLELYSQQQIDEIKKSLNNMDGINTLNIDKNKKALSVYFDPLIFNIQKIHSLSIKEE